MTGYRCSQSGEVSLRPPIPSRCPGGRIEPVELSGRGKVYSCTTLHTAAESFEKDLPFQIAIVELEEGPRLTARIEGARVKIDDPVELAAQRDGVWFFSRNTPTN